MALNWQKDRLSWKSQTGALRDTRVTKLVSPTAPAAGLVSVLPAALVVDVDELS